jgi:CP family cyanate transporter-like MFS transporter
VFASLGFALLPRLATRPGQMVKANGLLAQCGASGSLLGPPTMAACVQFGGWPAAAVLGGVVSLIALPLAWRAASAATRALRPLNLPGAARAD